MKLIKPSVEIIKQDYGLLGCFKQIEKAARTCYLSEDKITEDSWQPLLDKIANSKHYSPFEFGTVYLYFKLSSPLSDFNYLKTSDIVKFYLNNKYSKVVRKTKDHYTIHYYVTTNMRVIIENDRFDDLKYFCDPTQYHKQRVCYKIITDRGVLCEATRHRTMSWCVESTRYCNYSKGKYNSELTYIIPPWSNLQEGSYSNSLRVSDENTLFVNSLLDSEDYYMDLISEDWTPQQARQVLPNALKTTIMMCGFEEDFDHFFDLRTSVAAHPSMKQVANLMLSIFPNKEIKEKYENRKG